LADIQLSPNANEKNGVDDLTAYFGMALAGKKNAQAIG
jgi:hypothetical protein